jgi:hypothetical protein
MKPQPESPACSRAPGSHIDRARQLFCAAYGLITLHDREAAITMMSQAFEELDRAAISSRRQKKESSR